MHNDAIDIAGIREIVRNRMWILNEMKRGDTVKGRNQFRRKKKVFRKRNFWCSMYNR